MTGTLGSVRLPDGADGVDAAGGVPSTRTDREEDAGSDSDKAVAATATRSALAPSSAKRTVQVCVLELPEATVPMGRAALPDTTSAPAGSSSVAVTSLAARSGDGLAIVAVPVTSWPGVTWALEELTVTLGRGVARRLIGRRAASEYGSVVAPSIAEAALIL